MYHDFFIQLLSLSYLLSYSCASAHSNTSNETVTFGKDPATTRATKAGQGSENAVEVSSRLSDGSTNDRGMVGRSTRSNADDPVTHVDSK